MKKIRVSLLGLILMSLFAVSCFAQLSDETLRRASHNASFGDLYLIKELAKSDDLGADSASKLLKTTVWSSGGYKEIYKTCELLIQHGARYELSEWDIDHLSDRVFPDNHEIVRLLVKNMSFKGKAICKTWRFLGLLSGDNKKRRNFFEKINGKKKVENRTPLMYAANKANYSELKKLIKLDVNINAKDSDGHTALYHCANSFGDDDSVLKCCKYLVKHGATVNFDCSFIYSLYKYDSFSHIRDFLYENMSIFVKMRYNTWNFLASEKK